VVVELVVAPGMVPLRLKILCRESEESGRIMATVRRLMLVLLMLKELGKVMTPPLIPFNSVVAPERVPSHH